MDSSNSLTVHTKKNWPVAHGLAAAGLWLMLISIVIALDGENFSDQLLCFGVFLIGLLLFLALPYTNSIEEKDLVFSVSSHELHMTTPQDREDADFNRTVPLAEIKRFYYRSGIRWRFLWRRRVSEFVSALFYVNSKEEENLFLDLTLPEVKLSQEQITQITDFVTQKVEEFRQGKTPPSQL